MTTPREAARERAAALAAEAAALATLADLDLSAQLEQLATADRRCASARRSAERAEREVLAAKQARDEVVDTIRRAVGATGVRPERAAAVLDIPVGLCRPPVADRPAEPEAGPEAEAEPAPEAEAEPWSSDSDLD